MNHASPNVSTTSLGQPFLDAFASGLLSKFPASDEVGLSKTTIIVPRETARIGLLEALTIRISESAILLPRVYVLNDNLPSHAPWEQTDLGRLLPSTRFHPGKPMPAPQRRLLLAALIQQWRKSDRGSNTQSFRQSLKTATALTDFIDELHATKLDYSCMDDLLIRDHASHWAGIKKFLAILSQQWPVILNEKSLKDPFLYDAGITQSLAQHWEESPPSNPIIAAGFIGSLPHVTELLVAISRLPLGHVVIPSLDCDLQEKLWVDLPEEHTQYGLKRLLECLGMEYKEVRKWFDNRHSSYLAQRQKFLQTAIWPVNGNHTPEPHLEQSEERLAGLMQITCRDTSQEARVIALVIKEFLDQGEGNVAIITSDNQLLKRISIELQRWKIDIRQPLHHKIKETRIGTFLQLVASMICLNVTPVSLLSALKHPMCHGNNSPRIFREIVKQLENRCLRGIRPEPGIFGIIKSLRIVSDEDKRLLQWLRKVNIASQRFCSLVSRRSVPLRDLLITHLEFSAWLCQDGTEQSSAPTTPSLEDTDKAAYQYIVNLGSCLDDSLVVDGKEYSDIFQTLISNMVIGVQSFTKSRIYTYSPASSVFHSASLNILAGMNKDFGSTESTSGAWMTTKIRQSIGLPNTNLLKGISNFELCQWFTASQVVLTRSKKRNGRECQPSNHFARLKNALEKARFYNAIDRSNYWNNLAQNLDYVSPPIAKIERPAPRPPRSARPRALSATQIEQWMHDPYSIFAGNILHLRKLRTVDAKLQPADYGRMVHTALENFVTRYPTVLPPNSLQELLRFGRKAFMPAHSQPEIFSFWWSRFERSAAYFLAEEKKNRSHYIFSHVEVPGSININLPQGEFSLTAKADRISLRRDGTMDIVDYKTGSPPSSRQILTGAKPQLLIEAVIALYGDYQNINTRQIRSLVSLRLNGGSPAGRSQVLEEDIPLRAAEFLTKLRELIVAFDDDKTPYYFVPTNGFTRQNNDFRHLARMDEWLLGSGLANAKP